MVQPEAKYDFTRDLVGYGQDSINCQWPNGARIAVSICVNYEEGAESTILNGDEQSETMNWEKSGGSPIVGARHTNVESEYEYGSRSGMWRIMRAFAKHNYHFTTFAVGQALEKNPAVAKACVAAGHEMAGHGYRWLDYKDFSAADEKASIKQGIQAIKDTSGVYPKGWFVGRGSPNSVGVCWEAFREMGLELKWNSDAFNDDVPYWVDVPLEKELSDEEKKGLVILPYDYHMNDMKFVAFGNYGGSKWEDLLIQAFDMLYEEGGKMMSLGLHPRLTGKPGRAKMLNNFLDYISKKEGVWVATRAEIAEHFAKVHPYNSKR